MFLFTVHHLAILYNSSPKIYLFSSSGGSGGKEGAVSEGPNRLGNRTPFHLKKQTQFSLRCDTKKGRRWAM
jgi:hypothetical protein